MNFSENPMHPKRAPEDGPRCRRGLAAVALAAVFLAGCETMSPVDRRVERDPALFNALPESHQALVRQGKVKEGMSKDAVFLAWGRPHEIKQGSRDGKSNETWLWFDREPAAGMVSLGVGYGYGYGGLYGYIEDFGHSYGCRSPFWDDFAYRERLAATVEFSGDKVVAWERSQGR